VSKVFDSVSHQTLWVACRKLGVPEHLIKYLKGFYDKGTTKLKLPRKMGREIEINRGIKQGDPQSAHLFNAVIELCTENLDNNINYKFKNGATITYMAYADDLVFFSMPKGITTLLPKVIGTTNPAEIRPTTVTSKFSRLYHCILGERFANTLPYNDRQKGFKKGDGLYFNTKLLQKTISEAKAKYKNLKLAFIDVSKAFDSVSHHTL